MSAPDGLFAAGDVLPDISSRSSILNIGGFRRYGYAATVAQNFSERLEASVSYGRSGALTTVPRGDGSIDSASDLRALIQTTQRNWVATRISATLPVSGTQIISSYQWMDPHALMPSHLYLTQRGLPETGLGIRVRQPVPVLGGLIPGRLEATADLQNLLAQGYLPIPGDGPRRIFLTQSPRAIRGGLSYIF
jgi:hypothetical protein